ncbi:MAG: hypothetical protein ACR2K2_13575 [Mycobacteriales bacterium]
MAGRRGAGALTHQPPDAAAEPPPVPDLTIPTPAKPATPAKSAKPAKPPPPWWLVSIPLAVAVVALAVVVGALRIGPTAGTVVEAEPQRRAALEAARERTVALTSYDYRRLDQDFAAVLATATGQFAEDYRNTSAELRPDLLADQAVATTTVVAAGLESFAPDRAVAVIAVNQVITVRDAPRPEGNRIRMTLVRPADTWLVERVERL